MVKKEILFLILYAFFGLYQMETKEVEMKFENGSSIVEEESQLYIQADAPIEAYLVKNGEVLWKVEKMDWQQNGVKYQINYHVKEPGWYVLYNQDKKFLCEAIYYSGEMMMTSHNFEMTESNGWWFLNQKGPLFLIDKAENHSFDSCPIQTVEKWQICTREIMEEGENKLDFGEKNWQIWLDTIEPEVDITIQSEKIPIQISENNYILNDEKAVIQITKKDNSDTVFPPKTPWKETEKGYVLEMDLQDGDNFFEDILQDLAGNLGYQPFHIFLDTNAPEVTLPKTEQFYFNEPQIIQWHDDFLDWQASVFTLNGVDMKPLCHQENQEYSFELTESGRLHVALVDIVGNLTLIDQEVIFDTSVPTYQIEKASNGVFVVVQDDCLDQNTIKHLQLDGVIGIVKDNQCFFQVAKDGLYELTGEVSDLAGNQQVIQETIPIDVNEPLILCKYQQASFYQQPTTIALEINDFFMKEWQVDLYRNDKLYKSWSGKGNDKFSFVLDDSDYLDGQGIYRLEAEASDGTFQSRFSNQWIMDTMCAPIFVKINDVFANQVEDLTIFNPTDLSATCSEGEVTMELYSDDSLIWEEITSHLTLLPENRHITHLLLKSQDQFGHTQTKKISFEYGELLNLGTKTKIEKTTGQSSSMMLHRLKKVVGKKENRILWWIGGGMIAISFMRCTLVYCLRHRKAQTDLLGTQTIVLKNKQ